MALRHEPHFDWAQTARQIAVVLASVCLITPNPMLPGMSALLAASGTLLMLNGYTLAFKVPFAG